MKIFVTGGAGFIGSALVRKLIESTKYSVVNIDKLTYAGNLASLKSVANNPRYTFAKVDITNRGDLSNLFQQHKPVGVIHLAAESHVDRSIDGPADFIHTNVVGTYTLLEAAREFHNTLDTGSKEKFRFHHVSTDEVFGSLGDHGFFTETSRYEPNSPYSASKAGSDHLVRAWHHTFHLPCVMTNCSNNYGPYHFPEKLIPLIIINGMLGKPLPVYGKGNNIRDWLFVEDHADALLRVFEKGLPGETYNIGGHNERTNLEVVHAVCDLLDELAPKLPTGPRRGLVQFVQDRPGHDMRYAIDAGKIKRELGWQPQETFETGLKKTVAWYLENSWWWQPIYDKKYGGQRLGIQQVSK